MEVVSGLIESFMHKVKLLPGEKTCLQRNFGVLAGDVMGVGRDVVTAVKGLIPDPRWSAPRAAEHRQVHHGKPNLLGAGLDGAMKITSLVTLCSQLMKTCVRGDALNLLTLAGHNLMNATYVENRFLVSGVDIAHSLADGIMAFEQKDFKKFGVELGTSLRKILLSKTTHGAKLPEGMPEQDIIEEVMQGVMSGFFVAGSAVKITDSADPRVDIVLNLHQCIAGNSAFFKDIFFGLWTLVAQLSMNKEQHGLGSQAGQQQWTDELMMAMANFPMAIEKCNIGAKTAKMFSEAIYSLREMQVQIVLPKDAQKVDAAGEMAKAVDAWTKWHFELFGRELGMLLRGLVLQSLPRAYSIDASGRLQRDDSTDFGISTKPYASVVPTIIAGVIVTFLAALLVVRLHHSQRRKYMSYHKTGSDAEPLEVA
jgi:hypothetical protein